MQTNILQKIAAFFRKLFNKGGAVMEEVVPEDVEPEWTEIEATPYSPAPARVCDKYRKRGSE